MASDLPFIEENIIASDSTHKTLFNKINLFKYSNQQKELHAFVTKSVLEEVDYHDPLSQDLLFQHFKNLLNSGLLAEGYSFYDSLYQKGFFSIPVNTWKTHYWLALCYYFDNKDSLGLKYLDLALTAMQKSAYCTSEDFGTIHFYQGLHWAYLGQREKALPYFKKAINLSISDSYIQIEARRRISSTLTLQKNHIEALDFINQAINVVLNVNKNSKVKNVSDKNINFSIVKYADLLQSRAYAYREMARGRIDSLQYLNLSLQDAENSILAFEKHKRQLIFESDVIYLNNIYKFFYSKTIEALSRIYEVTGDDALLYKALRYSEMEKVSALVYSVQRNKALYQSGIPAEKVAQLVELNQQLDEVEALRFQEQANIRINDTALFDLNMKLYQLVSEISEQEKQLEQQNAMYSQIKYDVQPPNLDYVMELSKHKAVVEYVLSSEKLYTFVVVDGKIHFKHEYFDKDFLASIEKLQQMISNIKEIDFSLAELQTLADLSANLYNVLLKPFEEQLKDKPLLIVPDEQLSLIPFEILLKTSKPITKINYAELDYLLYHHDISYAYSLNLMQKQTSETQNSKSHQVFAMAPGYKKLAGHTGKQYIALRDARDNLGMLKGAQKEVKMVGKRLQGEIVFDQEASEELFKSQAGNYGILHLAMHTLVNNEDPLYSKLVFTPDADTDEDGLLNTYELANLDLGADLVVLSACNTGFGKLNRGEGIIGLTRGFFQAGCKSLLATLWSVSDETSLRIIDGFYTELEKQQTKSFSLTESKRNYVKQAKGMWAHPFFWAGYISIGDDKPIETQAKERIPYSFVIGVLLFLILAGSGFWLYKRKKAGDDPGFQSN
ncbi:MAG: CHAT domain-containing protein [Salinivirgaceae bacterium]